MVIKKFKVEGMHCGSCEEVIKRTVAKIDGVSHIEVDYVKQAGEVEYDPKKTNIEAIIEVVVEKGYGCNCVDGQEKEKYVKKNKNRLLGIISGVIGLVIIGYFFFMLTEGISLPEISQNMGLGLLFLVGLLTGFHCISMCGGFVISYTTKDAKEGRKPHVSHLMYATGKVISYTLIGAAFGLLGSIIAFTPAMRGIAGILAGIFLIVFGLNMLNVIPGLRKFRIKTPSFINKFVGEKSGSASPLIIGLLNGLMIACGPLQAIYIMAAGTGSMIEGAKLLFVFALGTIPVMLGFGFLTSFVSKKATHKILKASGVIVIILGLIMVNRGLALTGTGLDTTSLLASVSAGDDITGNAVNVEGGYQTINMDVTRNGWEPDTFVLKKGVPVRWVINGKEITGCNNAIQVPKLGLEFDIKQGEQVIEFTPTEEGIIPWSCWMGMISGTFIVKDDVSNVDVQQEIASAPKPEGGSSGCGCGCGGG